MTSTSRFKPSSMVLVLDAAISSIAYSAFLTFAPLYFLLIAARPAARAESQSGSFEWSLRSKDFLPFKTSATSCTDFSRKSTGSYISSAMPRASASLALSMVLLFSEFCRITFTALVGPIIFGKMVTPDQPGISPINTSGSAIYAVDATVRYWQESASSVPPPSAKPFTKQKVGIFEWRSFA